MYNLVVMYVCDGIRKLLFQGKHKNETMLYALVVNDA